jgi:hypothetical protein
MTLQEFRDFLRVETDREVILKVLSGVRCLEHNNKSVKKGGAGSYSGSQHTWDPKLLIWEDGRPCAADLRAIDKKTGGILSPRRVHQLAIEFGKWKGLGLYSWGIHVDVRQGRKARWGGK